MVTLWNKRRNSVDAVYGAILKGICSAMDSRGVVTPTTASSAVVNDSTNVSSTETYLL